MERATIVGGGIAGLTLAAALTRGGYSFEVLEARNDTDFGGGAALAMAPNAMWVLRRLGLADQVVEPGSRIDRYLFLDAQGHELKALNLSIVSKAWAEAAWCVPREHILRVLAASLPIGTLIRGAAVNTVQPDGTRFQLNLADGGILQSSLLIGADGAHSVVRRSLWSSPAPRYQGFIAIRGTLNYRLPASHHHTVVQVWGGGREFGYSPMGAGQVYWFATLRWPDLYGELPSQAAVHQQFAHWAGPIPDLIASTPPASFLIHPIYDRLAPFAELSRPATLIGDAAHLMTPNTGQGACQGMLDAWALAAALESNASTLAALGTYRKTRLQRALHVAQWSHFLGQAIHQPYAWVQRMQTTMMAAIPPVMVLRAMRHVVGTPQSLHLEQKQGQPKGSR